MATKIEEDCVQFVVNSKNVAANVPEYVKMDPRFPLADFVRACLRDAYDRGIRVGQESMKAKAREVCDESREAIDAIPLELTGKA